MAQRFYRPELDLVRFLAFFTVFLSHGLPSSSTNTTSGAFVRACSFGLSLFFSLSAYLITRLLLLERDRTGAIALASFYKRRLLRIWPLYITVLGISALFSVLHGTIRITGVWYLAALLMVANAVYWVRTTVVHLWSISVEEQFYLFWPFAMARLSERALSCLAYGLLVSANLVLAYYGLRHARPDGVIWHSTFVQMEFFAGGILLALYEHRSTIEAHPLGLRWLLLSVSLAAWFAAVRFLHAAGNPDELVLGPGTLCCGYFVAMLGCVGIISAVRGLDRLPKTIVYLGKISYGLYVFHAPALNVGEHLLLAYGRASAMIGSFVLTTILAMLSYHFLEAPFLRMKERFATVPSRPVGV